MKIIRLFKKDIRASSAHFSSNYRLLKWYNFNITFNEFTGADVVLYTCKENYCFVLKDRMNGI